jgi:asparagine synthase (glutamine-hydrolysing)
LGFAGCFGPFRKAGKFAPFLTTNLPDYYYSRVSSPFSYFNQRKEELFTAEFSDLVGANGSLENVRRLFRQVEDQPVLNQMQYLDTKTTLPDDLLVKADRITMCSSLELRVPFLDHVLLEFAASLPTDFKVRGMETKRILKHAFRNVIPSEIIHRKKAGFPIPIQRWVQNELREKVREVLLSQKFLGRGYFKKVGIERLLTASEQGQPVAKEIFSLLTLELLHQQFVDSGPVLSAR